MTETWTNFPDNNPSWEISDLGRIRFGRRIVKIKPTNGRRYVRCNLNGTRVSIAVAALVLWSFDGAPVGNKNVARHLDDDKTNDRLSNLAWGTHNDNYDDAIRNGIVPPRKRKQIVRGVEQITRIRIGQTVRQQPEPDCRLNDRRNAGRKNRSSAQRFRYKDHNACRNAAIKRLHKIGRTREEIGSVYKISHQRVSQILAKILSNFT